MRKKGLSSLVIIALVLVILALTNPTQADFKAYKAERASSQVSGKDQGGIIGTISKGVGAVAGGAASIAGGAYARKDYLVCSTFSFGDSGDLYLGFAKRVFLKLR